jgi:hypothetical protein
MNGSVLDQFPVTFFLINFLTALFFSLDTAPDSHLDTVLDPSRHCF